MKEEWKMRFILAFFVLSAICLGQAQDPGSMAAKVDKTDVRLTDARTPTAHTHVIADITDYSAPAASGGFASGDIIFRMDACSTGWTEVANAGAYLMLTTVAAGGAGTTGGSNSYTPAGTVSQPTFTGSALASHTHTVTQSAFVTTKFTTNSSGTAAYTSGGVVTTPSGGPSATLTPSGTVSQPTFTGTPATIQPAYLKLIACKKQ